MGLITRGVTGSSFDLSCLIKFMPSVWGKLIEIFHVLVWAFYICWRLLLLKGVAWVLLGMIATTKRKYISDDF